MGVPNWVHAGPPPPDRNYDGFLILGAITFGVVLWMRFLA
jgi:hypothetical protein